jgi:hypothetical protein
MRWGVDYDELHDPAKDLARHDATLADLPRPVGAAAAVVFDDAGEPVQAFPPFEGDLVDEVSEHDRSKLHIYAPDVWSRQPFLRRLLRQPPSREIVAPEPPRRRRIRAWRPKLLPRGKDD